MALGRLKHILALEKEVRLIKKMIAEIAKRKSEDELLKIITRPGWTTPAEYAFTKLLLNQIKTQLQSISELRENLNKAADQVKLG